MQTQPKNMLSQEFQETHSKILDTGNRLLNYLKQYRAEKLKEEDKTEEFQSIENDIIKALKALVEQKYQVAVIAAMKAGKSTFLNAIIGADVLASEAESCTVCPTDIRPIHAGQIPRLLEFQEGRREPVILVEGEPEEIQKRFLERTHEIRADANRDNTIRFQLEHPIEAISKIPSLAGFTLVDTPGPNEWESASFNTVALKQNALEALRTCDAILFILDYTSFRDNTNAELLQDLIKERSEFLAQNTNKIYFILNKVDRKAERDRPIVDIIETLRNALLGFGIPEPVIYPVSAWQGLLAKLIHKGKATDSHIKDFEDFFSAKYAEKDSRGRRVIPLPEEIASQALIDSGIPNIEKAVIQSIIQNSGWNLLSEVLAIFIKSIQSIEQSFITEIRGWLLDIEQLQREIEDYKKCSDYARMKVANVKKSVEKHKNTLINQFNQGVYQFAEIAKKRIAEEIDKVAKKQKYNKDLSTKHDKSLLSQILNMLGSDLDESFKSEPYKIKLKSKKDADKIGKTINRYCTPIIQNFWIGTQDKLVQKGTKIREELVQKIQKDIQDISDEVSEFIEQSLEVEIGTNPIQFPKFEFSGIDAKVKKQQEVITRIKTKTKRKSRCCKSDKVYEVEVPYKEKVTYYEINLRLTTVAIQKKIDEQVQINLELLKRVIEKQITQDFHKAEKQINDYINRFQTQFDKVLIERATRELESPQIIADLETQRIKISEYLNELISIRAMLDNWKPN